MRDFTTPILLADAATACRHTVNRHGGNAGAPAIVMSRPTRRAGVGLLVSLGILCSIPAPREAPAQSPPFTVVVLPDTQNYSASYPAIFTAQTQWIVDNKDALNIVFVAHVGDVVESCGLLAQWENADDSMSLLDGVVPYMLVPGNHDTNKYFNKYFPPARFESRDYYGGHYPANGNQNNYGFFSAGGYEFLVMGLEWGASGTSLSWAESVLDANRGRSVIVVTHSFLSVGGVRSSYGTVIWNNLIKYHNNILLVLSGHEEPLGRRTDYVNGQPIHQVMQDYQHKANGGNGWLRCFTFVPEDGVIHVTTYSPYLDEYDHSATNEFSLDLPTPCHDPLTLSHIGNLLIDTPRSVTDGFTYRFGAAVDPFAHALACVRDGNNEYVDMGASTARPIGVHIARGAASIRIEGGDHVTLTRDDATTLRVYFPALNTDDDVVLYVAADGSTYWDACLCTLAEAAPPSATRPSLSIRFQPIAEAIVSSFPLIDTGDSFGTPWPIWGWGKGSSETPTPAPTVPPTMTPAITPTPTDTPAGTPESP